MKDITENVSTIHLAKDLADTLNVSPVTLKKYSLLIEKLSEGAVLFNRNDDKSRLYTDMDVLLIKRTLDIREKEGITYENAVTKALIERNILAVPVDTANRTAPVPPIHISDGTAETFIGVLNAHNDRIDHLIESQENLLNLNKEQNQQIQDLIKQNELLLEQLRLNPPQEDKLRKKSWWQFWK